MIPVDDGAIPSAKRSRSGIGYAKLISTLGNALHGCRSFLLSNAIQCSLQHTDKEKSSHRGIDQEQFVDGGGGRMQQEGQNAGRVQEACTRRRKVCTYCGKSYARKALSKHVQNMHIKAAVFKVGINRRTCNLCADGKVYTDYGIVVHVHTEHPQHL